MARRPGKHGDPLPPVGPTEVSLRLDGEWDLERGDILSTSSTLSYTDQFEADLDWLEK